MDQAERQWLKQRAMNVLGHELRTPASTVRGLAEALALADDGSEDVAGNVDPPTRAEIVAALVRNARRLETLVDDLLTATDIATALPVGPREPVDVAEEFVTQWGEEPGMFVQGRGVAMARRSSLTRIVGAIVDNARLYGERPVTVTVDQADHVFARVASPGTVLPDTDIRFALEPFWRGERAVTTAPGLGIGLTVAATLASHERGRLWVEALAGGGVLTVVELPAK